MSGDFWRLISLVGQNHKVLVPKDKLTSKGLYPSSHQLYDLMHITTCEQVLKRWEEEWSFCPVCLARYEADGSIVHTRYYPPGDKTSGH